MSFGPPQSPPPWGPGQSPYAPPSGPYAPPGPYGPPGSLGPPQGPFGMPGGDPTLSKLASDTQTWIIVGAVGWFFGLMWVTGPLAWYQSAQINARYQQLGVPAPGQVNTLRLIGMVTTIMVIVGFVAVCGITLMGVGLAAFTGTRHG